MSSSVPFRVLLGALALTLPACGGNTSAHDFSSDVEECKSNLRAIFSGLSVYRHEKGRLPEEGGVAFFADLIASGVWENDPPKARILQCPGVPLESLSVAGTPPEDWFDDLEGVDGASSSYAGRDVENHPLASFPGPGTEPIVACDNHDGTNHADVTNVLMSDGSIVSLELATEIELGNLPEGTERIVVGPDALLPELRKLSLD